MKGTWEPDGDRLRVDWFKESGKPPRTKLAEEIERLSTILGRDLRPEINIA